MPLLGIILNIITISMVLVLLYVIQQLYKISDEKNIPVREIMSIIEKDPVNISHAYFYEQSGAWSTSDGMAWADEPNSKLTTLYDI